MEKSQNITKLPNEFKKYFWDTDFNRLDLGKHRKFILERLLNYGTFDTFNWIFRTFNVEEVRSFINNRGKNSLSKNSLYFWEKIAKEKSLWKHS